MKSRRSFFHNIIAVLLIAPGAGLLPSLSAVAAERDSLKLLMIGNSFSDYPTVDLPGMVKAANKSIVLGRVSLGGCTLERHAKNLRAAEAGAPEGAAYLARDSATGKRRKMTMLELLTMEPWDIVTIQQASVVSFKPETYQPFADEIIAAIHKYAPTAEIVVQETWAYREDHDLFKKEDGFTPAKMYSGIRETYHAFADGKRYRIIPTGDAMNLARQTPRWTYTQDSTFDFKNPPIGSYPNQHNSLFIGWFWTKNLAGKPIFVKDAIHTNAAGRYLGTCVWYMTLFNTSTVPASYLPKDVSPEDAAILRAHASAAVVAERNRKPGALSVTSSR